MKVKTFDDLFVHELKDLYSAEKQIFQALGKMAEAASSEELKQAFLEHQKETEQQKKRIETIFEDLDYQPGGSKCEAAEGLIAEGEELLKELEKGEVRDAALIAAAQRVEHYEIAGYGTARTYARILGNTAAERLLQETLDEEGNTDKKLSGLARNINKQAARV